ncbi:hypothetical protein C2869_07700 [Saccharobesus litoralis]|uniref:Cysteine-rich CWC n=1 Tax=Saccharobesus litoralis TaxID=2172099 RepID=A0A2S0VQ49_9ALTE|nr:cysteine-rich CWC family protein [Saccharobesus litoralis]AWB66323.1 hypothetical protein C2869_07700 [Saccharobesus litoralis]
MSQTEYVSPEKCPLCNQANFCGNLSNDDSKPCWCMDDNISFPGELLQLVPSEAQGKACICKACAQKFQQVKAL